MKIAYNGGTSKSKVVGGCCGGGGPRWGVGGIRGQSAAVRATRSPTRCWEHATQPTAARGCSWLFVERKRSRWPI